MTTLKIIQYIHRPNLTELGLGNTNDRYLVVDSTKDLSDVFPLGVAKKLKDITSLKEYEIYSKIENNEFRLKQLGTIVDDYNMELGDEIVITHYESSDNDLNLLTVNKCGRVLLNPGNKEKGKIKDFEIVNIGKLPGYSQGTDYKCFCEHDGLTKELLISFSESRNKRADSPTKTDFYSVKWDNTYLDNSQRNNYYYLTNRKGKIVLEVLPKSEYRILLEVKDIIEHCPNLPLQQIFYGAPGTGKSHRIKKIIQEHGINEKEQVIRTTFHPDSDYSTFVGCYKPIMKKVPQTYVVEGNEKPVMADKDNQATKDEIVYDYTPQAFVQAYTKAWTNPGKAIVLVIEEINRGNCAQIFGDIFQLLDRGDNGVSDYVIKPDKALEDYLKGYFEGYPNVEIPNGIRMGEFMKLSANLYIWATMNTSDQSLFPIDSAFKRRWEWKYIKIAKPEEKDWQIADGTNWWAFLQQINAIIGNMTNSADKQLGYFFAKAKDDVISYDTFVSKVCFYLWNDIFKTYAIDEQQGDLFSYTDIEGKKKQLTFPSFYDGDGNVIKEVAEAFIGNVMRWNTDTKNDKE